MASSSSSPAASPLVHPVSEKLARDNFLVWKAQILPAVRGAQLMGFLDGKAVEPAKTVQVKGEDGEESKPNPAYL